MEYVTLNNGIKMPKVGFGVFQIEDQEECKRCVLDALDENKSLWCAYEDPMIVEYAMS